MSRFGHVSLLGSLATVLFLAAPAIAVGDVDAGEIPGVNPAPPQPGGGEPVNPNDVNRAAEDIQNRVNNVGGGNGYIPDSGAGRKGFKDIDDEVGATLSENLAITGFVSGALALTTAAGWFLASRYIDPKVALMNPQRSMLYGFVKGNPGVHLKQLSTEFRMKTSTVLWHVRKLESADLLRSKKANGYRVFYPVSGGIEASKVSEAVTALSNTNARGIFSFLNVNPGAPLRALSENLALNPGTVRWHLKKMRRAGLLEDTPHSEGPRVTDLGLKAWVQVQGLTPQPIEVGGQPQDVVPDEVAVYN